MSEKKQPGRFTIQFSMDDPQQKITAEILEGKGRRKAQFITNAVLFYLEQTDTEKPSTAPEEISEELLERMILSVIQKSPQIEAALHIISDTHVVTLPESDSCEDMWGESSGTGAVNAISSTLKAFRQG